MPLTTAGCTATLLVRSSFSVQKVGVQPEMFTRSILMIHTGEIIACRINCPGSWHDSRVAEGIYEKLEKETPNGFRLVADSAFPQGSDRVAGKICIPLKASQPLPLDFYKRTHAIRFSRAVLSYCQTAEWGMRELQALGANPCLPSGYVVGSLWVLKQNTQHGPTRSI